MKKISFYLMASIITAFMMTVSTSCEKDDDNSDDGNDNGEDSNYQLVIKTGAQNIEPDESLTYSAVLVNEKGESSSANVSWSVTPDSVAGFNGNTLTPQSTGKASVTATVTKDGNEYTASVPIGVYQSAFFAVAPAAILYEAGYDIELNPVYFGTENPTFSYNSTDASVATVSNSGVVSLQSPGECVIEVTADIQTHVKVRVPVMVIGSPSIPLPVTRVELDKYSLDLFKNESAQLTATAYNANNEVVDTEISWSSADTDIATVTSDGTIDPLKNGKTKITAEADGIIAQCDLLVNPDTVVIVKPLYKSIQKGGSHQFTAEAYENTRSGLGTKYNVDFTWVVPDYGPYFEMFNIATVNDGNVSVKNDAMPGMSTVVVAHETGRPAIAGGAMIMVDMGVPF